jgi:hypothetical protein
MSIRDRHKEFAAELAEAAMALARDVAQAALQTEAVADKVALTQAHERIARSVRLSIQLYERLERREREAADDGAPALAAMERRLQPQLDLRKAQVRAAVRRTIEQDYEGEDAELLETALDLTLAEQALTARFMDQPAIEAVNLIRKTLDLPDRLRIWLPDLKADPKAAPAEPPGRPGPS